MKILMKIVEPNLANTGGFSPKVKRIDLIRGEIHATSSLDYNDEKARAGVEKRVELYEPRKRGEPITLSLTVINVQKSFYVRLRGTSTYENEPLGGLDDEDVWNDLWFYSNPIFVETL